MRYYKFVKGWEPRPLEDVMKAPIPQALKAYDEGNQQPWKDMNIEEILLINKYIKII